MKDEVVIEVKDVEKYFKVYKDKGYSLKERVLSRKRNQYEKHNVLKGINFSIKRGEAVGLIGSNGCGKSTTLKLLTQIIYPDKGSIKVNGRVSSLLELGAGFHPDMSGRENIYINASIFGLTKKEIDRRIDDIIEFSELEEFMDSPVRTYSSGMYMRLAFSVAINVDADVLLIDEILAVGDTNFQIKCRKKLQEIKDNGTTIVLVSHSTEQVESICERSIWINEGTVWADGESKEVSAKYLEYMSRLRYGEKKEEIVMEESENSKTDLENIPIDTHKKVRLFHVDVLDDKYQPQNILINGQNVIFRLHFNVFEPEKCFIRFNIFNDKNNVCYGSNTVIDGLPLIDFYEDCYIDLLFPQIPLLTGDYYLSISIETMDGEIMDAVTEASVFGVHSSNYDIGICRMKHEWKENKHE